ncbi:hypothetical protein MBM09_01510 [Flaviramulus sp. BrNp1-15]|uniref:hypothetical protein n=1 Tax=Flaviramulus sp. BrNp1-15 TaxID=2916754 RepID=UPI001EE7A2CA|nr:hypothetical protein [Flaviramulus sp. BrNp1-15]ULC59666.1 hypothetical protein MBM09_01510 [Flaviramulus sp. BrNp1-15]
MIITYEELQSDFMSRSNELANKKLYIQDELKQINTFLNHKDYDVKPMGLIGEITNNYRPKNEIINKIFSEVVYGWETFSKAYENYYYEEKEVEFTPFKKTTDITQPELDRFNNRYKQYHLQGIEFAKYALWLKRHENKNVLSKPNTRKLTNKQKLLALHYLGLSLSKYDNTKTAKILSQILEVGEENIRINLSYVEGKNKEVRTIPNLSKISQLFESVGITDVSNIIDSEIENLK